MIKAKISPDILTVIEQKLTAGAQILLSYNNKNGKLYISHVKKSEVFEEE